jgi:photosystem II stability/assembly factor-like uncharacterized protein
MPTLLRLIRGLGLPAALLAISVSSVPASAAGWEPLPLWGGELQVVAVPGSAVVYAASGAAGIFRSDNGGVAWRFVGTAPEELQIFGVDPHDPLRLYGAAVDFREYRGFFRSEDGGETWERSDGGIPGQVFAVAFDPVETRMYAGTDTGLYLSDDAGDSWELLSLAGERVLEIAVAPSDPQVLLAGSQHSASTRRSTDRGQTFVEVLDRNVQQFAFDPAHPGRVYALDVAGGIARSDDLGAGWTSLPTAPSASQALAVTPAGTLLAASITPRGVARSTDGGATWELLAAPPDTLRSFAVLDGSVLTGGLRSVWRSLTDGRGWRESATGLRAQSILSLEVAADAASTVWSGTLGSLFTSRDDGASFQRRPSPLGVYDFLRLLTVHPRQPRIAYAYGCCAAQVPAQGLLKTENAGQSWRRLPYPGVLNNMTVIAVDPTNPQVVYAGGTRESSNGPCSALRSLDGGATWRCISPVRPSDLYSLVIDPFDPKVLYGLFDGHLFRSANRGTSWKRTPAQGSARLFGFLAPDPNRRDRLYGFSAIQPGIFRSDDGGRTWTAAANGLPASGYPRDLLVDPSRPGRIWVALRLFSQTGEELTSRIFRSNDSGRHWREESEGLEPGTVVLDLDSDPRSAGVIYAGTLGQGLYRLDGEP